MSDPRHHHIRTRLIAAFREVTVASPQGDIGLARIAYEAGVSRAELGAQFTGLAELAAAALVSELDAVATMDYTYRVEGRATGIETTHGSLVHVVRFLEERRLLYRDVFTPGSQLTDQVEDALAAYSLVMLRAREVPSALPEVDARVMAAGTMGAIYWWLRDDRGITVDELCTAISQAVPSVFTT